MTLIPIILSGGAGTRLWPLSWGDHPKQFLPLVSQRTMIQETLLRLKGLEIWSPIISCGEGHRFMVAQQIGEVMGEMKTLKQVQGLHTAFKKGHWSVEKGTFGAQKRTA